MPKNQIVIEDEVEFIRDVLYPNSCEYFQNLMREYPCTIDFLFEKATKTEIETIVCKIVNQGLIDAKHFWYGMLEHFTNEYFTKQVMRLYMNREPLTLEKLVFKLYEVITSSYDVADSLKRHEQIMKQVLPNAFGEIDWNYFLSIEGSQEYFLNSIVIRKKGTFVYEEHKEHIERKQNEEL